MADNLHPVDFLETPAGDWGKKFNEEPAVCATVSIAISLKRIADHFEAQIKPEYHDYAAGYSAALGKAGEHELSENRSSDLSADWATRKGYGR